MAEQIIFWILAAILIASACGVIALSNPINCIICLLVAMFSLAGIYVLMGAPVVALFQIIVYIGAIVVLFLFVIMLLNIKNNEQTISVNYSALIFSALAIIAIGGAVCFIWYALWISRPETLPAVPGAAAGVRELALNLLTNHLLALELTSLLLLVGAIGALIMSRKK